MTGRIFLAGGGTGGHVFPSLAVAAALRRARPEVEVEFVGTERGLESRLVPEAGYPLHRVEVLPLARKLSFTTARAPLALAQATATVGRLLRARQVVAAGVFGGYVSLPLAVAAWRAGIPYVVHEQNAVPGLANRVAVRRAAAVAATFPSSVERFGGGVRVEVTGNPVRPGFAEQDRAALRTEALRRFDLDPVRRTLLVFGGSQGAQRINRALVAATPHWRHPSTLQILHATGRNAFAEVEAAWNDALAAEAFHGAEAPLVRPVDFIERMELAYAAADLVVSRAGASTIAELTVLGLPSVLVPYPHATADHQTVNAQDLAAAGGAAVVTDAVLDGPALAAAAEPLLLDVERRAAMAAGARGFARPDAADRVAALLLEAVDAASRTDPSHL